MSRFTTHESSRRRGFTLIELLVVVIIIGALASLAVLRYQQIKEKSFVAAMQRDLRNLVNAQEQFFEREKMYADQLADLPILLRPDVSVQRLRVGDRPPVWSATVRHTQSDVTCTIVVDGSQNATGLMTCL